jgi:hypothetical protein
MAMTADITHAEAVEELMPQVVMQPHKILLPMLVVMVELEVEHMVFVEETVVEATEHKGTVLLVDFL